MPVRPLTPELAEKARVELNEDPKRLADDLQHIKDWISKQPHLRARTDDQWLAAFLRGCKFSLERTKEKLDLYYTCRTTAPEFYRIKHTNPKFIEILELGTNIILPKASGTDTVVSIIQPGTYDPDRYHISEVIAVSNILQQIIMMENDNAIVAGFEAILDLHSVTFKHFTQMTMPLMKKMVVTSQDATPLRFKGFHYLNTPTGFETIFNAIKGLLNEKNQKRLYVHNKNYEEMYKFIPQESLPSEYGGNAGSMKDLIDYWKKKVEEWGPWLEAEYQFGTDESLRPGKPKTAEDMFGVDGSFRQLELD